MRINRIVAALCAAVMLPLVMLAQPAAAQNNWGTPGGSIANGGVLMCLNASGFAVPCTDASALPIAVSGSFSLGGFQGNGNFANLTATAASSASTALPTGTSVRITNASSTATVSCTMSSGAATGVVNNIIIPPLSSVSRVKGTNVNIACIDQTGSTGSNLVVIEGGSGLGNDSGGGGGGSGGGGAITAAAGAYASGSIASGAMVDLGSQADAACGTDTGTCSAIALIKRGNQTASTTATNTAAAIPAQGSTGVNIGATTGAASAAVTMQNAAVANGNGTTLTVANYQTALVNVNCSVACSGGTTVNFEATDSTGTFFSVAAIPVTGGAAISSVTNLGTTAQYWIPVSGLTTLRARISAYSAGTITVTGQAMFGVNPLPSVSVANFPAAWSKWSTANNNSNTALTNTVVAVKSSAAGTFGGYFISNPNSSVACVQVFDVATAGAVTLGTTRPNLEFCIPANSAANWSDANGVSMANGIQMAATTTASGSTAPSTGLDVTAYFK